MSNHVIQSLWIGQRLSNMEKLCIRSFLSNGHDFHLYLYGPCEGVPNGTTVKDANNIVREPDIEDGYHKTNSAFFSDMFRYRLMQQEKHWWWVDMDTICLRPFDFEEPYIFATEVSRDGLGRMIDNGILKAPPDSELLRQLVERTKKDTFGPGLMTIITEELGLQGYAKAPHFFTPIMPWLIPGIFLEPKSRNPRAKPAFDISTSYAVHMWNSSWKYTDKDAFYDPGCLYEKLKRRYPESIRLRR